MNPIKYSTHIHYILVVLFLFNIIDGITTYIIMKNGGVELNPLMSRVMMEVGIFWGLLVTRLIYASVLMALWKTLIDGGYRTYLLIWLPLIFYTFVITVNVTGVLRYMEWILL